MSILLPSPRAGVALLDPSRAEEDPTVGDYLDMVQRGQVEMTWRFVLLEPDLTPTGQEIYPSADSAPSISSDLTAALSRTLSGVLLRSIDMAPQDYHRARLRVDCVLGDTGIVLPWGVFLIATGTAVHRSPAWTDVVLAMVDQTVMVDQPLDETVSAPPGYPVRALIVEALERCPADLGDRVSIDGSAALLPAGQPLNWAVGRDTWGKVLRDLANLGGYWPPYFDNHGWLRLRSASTSLSTPDVSYPGGLVFADSVGTHDVDYQAPNRFLVVNTSATASPIMARYDLPSSFPNSFQNRGFRVVKTLEAQGIASTEQAYAMAKEEALRSAGGDSGHLVFSGPPDPRYDVATLVEWQGEVYVQASWSCSLTPGAEMGHTLRRHVK